MKNIILLLLCFVIRLSAISYDLTIKNDNYVDQDTAPTCANYGNAKEMWVGGSHGLVDDSWVSYFMVDASSIAGKTCLTSATIYMPGVNTQQQTSYSLTFQLVSNNWNETSMTNPTKITTPTVCPVPLPSIISTIGTANTTTGSSTSVTFSNSNLLTVIQNSAAAGGTSISIRVFATTFSTSYTTEFYTKENGATHETFTVESTC
jgi:hypothetical protein